MISASADFDAAIRQSTRTFTARLRLNGTPLDCTLRTLVIHKGAMDAESGFTVGTVFSSFIDVVVDNLSTSISGEELELQIGLTLADSSIEYITLGYYTATKVKKTTYQTSFTGIGRIAAKFASKLYATPTVKSLSGIAASIATTTGVAVSFVGVSDTSGTLTANLSGLTCYEMLQILATAIGGYATETASGSVVISTFSTTPTESVDATRMISLPSFEEDNYTVTGARVLVREAGENEDGTTIDEVAYTYGTPTINIQNAYMTEDLFDDVFIPDILGYEFRPGSVPLSLGDPRIEATDVLEVTDRDENTFIVPCHSLTHTFDGGVLTDIVAAGLSDADDDTAGPRPITEQLERVNSALVTAQAAILNRATITELEAESARIDLLDATKAYVDTLVAAGITAQSLTAANAYIAALVADNVTAAQLSADNAYIAALTAAGITASSLTVANAYIADLVAASVTAQQIISASADIATLRTSKADIDFANVTTANISQAWVKDLFVRGGFVAQSGTVYELVGLHISGNLIDAGTLKADRILLSGDDGLYYQINLDRLGQATISAMTPAEQAALKQTIHADAITAHTITADHITVNNLVGTGGWINLADGTFEYRNAAQWANAGNGIKWNGSTLEIKADQLLFTSGVNAETAIDAAAAAASGAADAASAARTLASGLETAVSGGDSVSLVATGDTSAGHLTSGYVTVDVEKFVEAVGGVEESYAFAWDGTSWSYNNTTVDLYDYGLAIDEEGEEELQTGDTVTATYAVLSGLSFDMNDALTELTRLQGQVAANTSSIETSNAELDALDDQMTAIDHTLVDVASAVDTASAINARMTFGTAGGVPTLEIGRDDSDLKTHFTNEAIQFWDTNKLVAYITGQQMVISNVRVYNESGTSQFRIGGYALVARDNGHVTLKWNG